MTDESGGRSEGVRPKVTYFVFSISIFEPVVSFNNYSLVLCILAQLIVSYTWYTILVGLTCEQDSYRFPDVLEFEYKI